MRRFFSEYTSDYQTYTFWYTQYAVLDSMEELAQIYAQGFLPYSGDLTLQDSVFYRCRSVRVNLNGFNHNSENRRVARKAEPYNITRTLHHKSDFDSNNPIFEEFCLNYAHNRYGAENMPIERFRYIIQHEIAQYIMEYKSGNNTIGYVYFARWEDCIQYWFSYYDVNYIEQLPLGSYMMADMVIWAQSQWLSYVYLGTCYKTWWLYKVRNFNNIQRRDGNTRSSDVKALKALCKSDTDIKTQDQFKGNPNIYLK